MQSSAVNVPPWKNAPFIRLIIPFTLGIAFQHSAPFSLFFIVGSLLLCTLGLLLQASLPLRFRFSYRSFFGAVIQLFIVVSAMLVTYFNEPVNQKNWYGHHYNKQARLLVYIDEPLIEQERSYKSIAVVTGIIYGNDTINTHGRILLYFRKDSIFPKISSTGQLNVSAPLQPVHNTGNPGAFNYKKYAALQGIHHMAFLNQDDWKSTSHSKNFNLIGSFLFRLRERIIGILRHNIKGEKECGLAEALLIGYKEDLDKKLIQSYSNAGVVHVIAISGLHLGIIYLVLRFLLSPLRRLKILNIPWSIMIIAFLWLFSLLCGASASVLRSAVMFTAIVIGEERKRPLSIYNSLASSAFILLCYNPNWLFDIGFQLSYSAVLSIVIFMKPIYHLIEFQNKLIDHIWQLICITLAAQILTSPLILFYFHQFPLLFIITNLVAVPLSSIILIGELLLLVLSPLTGLNLLLGKLIEHLIFFMNYFVESIDGISSATLRNIYITVPQCLLLYGALISFSCFFLLKSRSSFFYAFASLLAFLLIRYSSFQCAKKQDLLIIYNTTPSPQMAVIKGRSVCLIGDTRSQMTPTSDNQIMPSLIMHRISHTSSYYPSGDKSCIVEINGWSVLIPRNSQVNLHRPVDVALVTQNPQLPPPGTIKPLLCRQVIIDASNTPYTVRAWKALCAELGIPCHEIRRQGAFVRKRR